MVMCIICIYFVSDSLQKNFEGLKKRHIRRLDQCQTRCSQQSEQSWHLAGKRKKAKGEILLEMAVFMACCCIHTLQ